MEQLVAETMRRVPATVTREELTSAALVALARAHRDHDPAADGAFAAYATTRVRAALVDTLRAIDWAARARAVRAASSPARLAQVRQAVAMLSADRRAVIEGYFLQQRPLPELADDLELDESAVSQLRSEALLALRRTLGPALADPQPWADSRCPRPRAPAPVQTAY